MTSESRCRQESIIAFIEGDLDPSSQALFEEHLNTCSSCRTDLTIHRKMFCELEAVLNQPLTMPTPNNFAQVVATRAETDMRGVRTRAEHKNALRLIAIIGLAAVSFLGLSAISFIIDTGRLVTKNIVGLTAVFLGAVYDAGASVTVLSRVLSRKVVIESGSLRVLVVVLGVAVLLLSCLITRYHRARAIE